VERSVRGSTRRRDFSSQESRQLGIPAGFPRRLDTPCAAPCSLCARALRGG
jgi:hypothetical protein